MEVYRFICVALYPFEKWAWRKLKVSINRFLSMFQVYAKFQDASRSDSGKWYVSIAAAIGWGCASELRIFNRHLDEECAQ